MRQEVIITLIITMAFCGGFAFGMFVGSHLDESDQPVLTNKTITVKDKSQLDDNRFIYTTDHEIFNTANEFIFRALAVNETYVIEYKPVDPERGLNPHRLSGHVVDVVENRKV